MLKEKQIGESEIVEILNGYYWDKTKLGNWYSQHIKLNYSDYVLKLEELNKKYTKVIISKINSKKKQ